MTSALILFPQSPFSRSQVEPDFETELAAARTAGFETSFYDHDLLENGEADQSLRHLPRSDTQQKLLLRGWMTSGENYQALFASLQRKGYQPQTTSSAYEQAHYLPIAYPLVETETARSDWISGDDPEAAWQLYQDFSSCDAIIKDWVKSAKHHWKDACFIPAHTDQQRFAEIFHVFRNERGALFNRGVVLREFMPVVQQGNDMRGMPNIEETRLFFWQGKALVSPANPDRLSPAELAHWEAIARRFESPFLTLDIVRLVNGTSKIVETGDGGVSGIPVDLDPDLFYRALWEQVNQSV